MVFVKGKSGNPSGKKKGTKNKETLLKEERRAIFDAEISKRWPETIATLKPEYVADQFMGKAPEKVEHSGKINITEEKKVKIKTLLNELGGNKGN